MGRIQEKTMEEVSASCISASKRREGQAKGKDGLLVGRSTDFWTARNGANATNKQYEGSTEEVMKVSGE